MRTILIFFLACIAINLQAQDKRDYIWFSAGQTDPAPGFETNLFDFNNQDSIVEIGTSILRYNRNNALICDREGNLLFYSNGCAVADRLHRIMPNGEGINDGEFFQTLWEGDCENGFPGRQDIIALPDPNDSLGYYLVTKLPEINQEGLVKQTIIQYSYIDLSLNEGYGDVTVKNEVIIDSIDFAVSCLNAIEHINKKDYWILQPAENSKVYTFLLNEEGINLVYEQEVSPAVDFLTASAGMSTFSTDGRMFAFNNSRQGIFLFDFDRDTGLLSNQRLYPIFCEFGLISMEFSPSGQFLYSSLTDSLFQTDIWEENVDEATLLIDTWAGVSDPFPSTFSVAKLAPDCRIYIAPGSSSRYYHFINKPDEKGHACDFRQRGLELPWISNVGNFPNYPRFRVDDEEKCNPSITTMFGEPVYYRKDLDVYPNPSNEFVTINLPEGKRGTILLYNLSGEILIQEKNQSLTQTLFVNQFPSGMYFLEFIPDRDLLVYTAKIVVE